MKKRIAEKRLPDEDLMVTTQAAKIAGVDTKTITRWYDASLITGKMLVYGNRYLYLVDRASLEAYLASRNLE